MSVSDIISRTKVFSSPPDCREEKHSAAEKTLFFKNAFESREMAKVLAFSAYCIRPLHT